EAKAALDEVVTVAEDNAVDLVIVAGDLFDRALPPFAVMGVVFGALQRLADSGAPVVAIAGNHDSAELFRVLKPYFASSRIYLADKALPPDEGGVIMVPSRDGKTTAQVALFPFLHEAKISELMEPAEEWHKKYADRIKRICSLYGDYLSKNSSSDTVEILVGHFMINGAIPSGSERGLHIGEAFTAETQAIPSDIHYGALGHIHLCQEAPGSAVAAHYAGSLLQLDFGEIDQEKFVLLVDVEPERPARVKPVAITQGRKLLRATDSLEGLRDRAETGEFAGAILDVSVLTDGPVAGLADDVREFIPDALYVRAQYDRDDVDSSSREGRPLDDLYGEYFRTRHGVDAKEELVEAFKGLVAEVGVDW
ncbi:MAG: exonuclease subunit SbcD, partial [Actinobacteria bacterium]|nr:exonuclease subunit SbcD [Actinomycetota bacterium]